MLKFNMSPISETISDDRFNLVSRVGILIDAAIVYSFIFNMCIYGYCMAIFYSLAHYMPTCGFY
jgi:hypothetical protein